MTIEQSLRIRAARSREFSRLGLLATLCTGMVLIFGMPLLFQNYILNLAKAHIVVTPPPSARPATADPLVQSKRSYEDLMRNYASLLEESQNKTAMISMVFDAVFRGATVLIAIFLMNVLIHFTRFHTQLAEHWEAVADVITLAGADGDKLESYFNVVSCRNIAFGKPPSTPIAEIAEVVAQINRARTGTSGA